MRKRHNIRKVGTTHETDCLRESGPFLGPLLQFLYIFFVKIVNTSFGRSGGGTLYTLKTERERDGEIRFEVSHVVAIYEADVLCCAGLK